VMNDVFVLLERWMVVCDGRTPLAEIKKGNRKQGDATPRGNTNSAANSRIPSNQFVRYPSLLSRSSASPIERMR
jgi:hypothetical protein